MAVLPSRQHSPPAPIRGVESGTPIQANGTASHRTSNGASRLSLHHPFTNEITSTVENDRQPSQTQQVPNGISLENGVRPYNAESNSSRPVDGQKVLALRPNDVSQGLGRNLIKAQTELNLKGGLVEESENTSEQNWELRHGWEDQYNSEEYLQVLSSV